MKLKKVCEELITYGITEIEIIIIQGSWIIDTFKINNIEDHNLNNYTSLNYDNIWYDIDDTKCGTVKAYIKINSSYFALVSGGWNVKEDIEEIVEEYNLTESEAEELLQEADRLEDLEKEIRSQVEE